MPEKPSKGKMTTKENQHVAGDCADEVESVEEEETGVVDTMANRILNFPDVLAALQQNRRPHDYLTMPEPIKKRVRSLKVMQSEQMDIEAKFFEEVHAIECKYHKLYMPLYEKRSKIISGNYEPTEEESLWPADTEEDELSKELQEKAKVDEKATEKKPADAAKPPAIEDTPAVGIPDFWLTIFRNVDLLAEMMHEHDEPIIKHLLDIKTVFHADPMGFTLEFHFAPNEHFTDAVLTKEYSMKCIPDKEDPFSFEGPEIFKCKGCTINWNKGKNITLKTVKKKQKHKSRGMMRTVTRVVQNDSFFNFFAPPPIPDDINAEEVDEETRNLLTTDFEIGHYIRERIVPRAVLYYTGEAVVDEDYDEEEEEEDDDDDEEEEEEESDGGGGGGKESSGGKAIAANQKDVNCKQQ